MLKIKSEFFLKKFTKSSKKRAFVRALRFRGKKPQGLYALRLSALLTTLFQTKKLFKFKANSPVILYNKMVVALISDYLERYWKIDYFQFQNLHCNFHDTTIK